MERGREVGRGEAPGDSGEVALADEGLVALHIDKAQQDLSPARRERVRHGGWEGERREEMGSMGDRAKRGRWNG